MKPQPNVSLGDISKRFAPLDDQIDVETCNDNDAQQQSFTGGAPRTENKCLAFVANNLHFATFLPLIVINILQDIDLGLAAVVCTCIVLGAILTSYLFHRAGYVKVFPKKYDLFNLQLYITIVVLAYCVHKWMHDWINVYVNGSNAWFMWATMLLPCCDCFVMDSVRDRLPEPVARHPLTRSMALWISGVWATALTIMTVASIVPAVVRPPLGEINLMTIMCSYVFGFGPMLAAIAAQHIIKTVFGKRIKKAFAPVLQHGQQAQEQAGVPAAVEAV